MNALCGMWFCCVLFCFLTKSLNSSLGFAISTLFRLNKPHLTAGAMVGRKFSSQGLFF